MALLRMDARFTRKEVHEYLDDGGPRFERLARDWGVEDMEQMREKTKGFA